MKEFLRKNWAKIIAFLILIIIILGVVSVIAIFGGFIMHFFGFQYESVGSIICFFLFASILSYPISLVAEALPMVLLNEFHRGTVGQARFLYLFMDTIATAIGLTVIDMFMDSVSASEIAVFVVSLLFALPGINDIKIKDENNE